MSEFPPELERTLDLKFNGNKAQMLQYYIKLYAEEFFSEIPPQEFYKQFKESQNVVSSKDFKDEELDAFIAQFWASLVNGVA